MKTFDKALIVAALAVLISSLSASVNAQVVVTIHQPPPEQLNVEHLWNFSLTNNTQETYKVYLRGTATKEREGLIFEGISQTFTLPAGFVGRVSLPEISPIDVKYSKREYEDVVLKTGSVPEGFYTVCIYLINAENGEELAQDCIRQQVAHPSPPQLISPADGATVEDEFPVFAWMPPMPLPQEVSYDLKIVEILAGQSPVDAMQSNPAWFEEEGILQTSFRYPVAARGFESGKSYCWQIQAIDSDGFPIGENEGKSEVWSFQFGEIVVVVAHEKPEDIELISPPDRAEIIIRTPTFKWAPIGLEETVKYSLIVWQLPVEVIDDIEKGIDFDYEYIKSQTPYYIKESIVGNTLDYDHNIDNILLPEFAYLWEVSCTTEADKDIKSDIYSFKVNDKPPMKHASEEGPEKSQDIPFDYVHITIAGKNKEKSEYLPSSWKHFSTEGAIKSMYLPGNYRHASEEGPDKSGYINSFYIHVAEEGIHKSKYVPKTWKHASEEGPDKSRYVQPNWHHSVEKNDKSRYVWISSSYKHAIEEGQKKSKYVPKTWKHASETGPKKSDYLSGDYRHASETGPNKSDYLPGDYRHASEEGKDKSTYFPSSYKHASEEGPEKSNYVLTSWKHASEAGPDKSKYFQPNWLHSTDNGPDKSKYKWVYIPTTMKHAYFAGLQKSRLVPKNYKHISTAGPNKSEYVPLSWVHAVKGGPDFTKFIPPSWKHSTSAGPYLSRYEPPGFRHFSKEGPNKTKYGYFPDYRKKDTDEDVHDDKPTYRHIADNGPDKSKIIHSSWKHTTESSDKSNYVPPDWKHVAKGIGNISSYVPPEYVHHESGVDASRYWPPKAYFDKLRSKKK